MVLNNEPPNWHPQNTFNSHNKYKTSSPSIYRITWILYVLFCKVNMKYQHENQFCQWKESQLHEIMTEKVEITRLNVTWPQAGAICSWVYHKETVSTWSLFWLFNAWNALTAGQDKRVLNKSTVERSLCDGGCGLNGRRERSSSSNNFNSGTR